MVIKVCQARWQTPMLGIGVCLHGVMIGARYARGRAITTWRSESLVPSTRAWRAVVKVSPWGYLMPNS